MATTNLALWDRLGKTDPAHTKPFTRGGGFKGTAIKPIYVTHKMTEEFGPAGNGWGMGEPVFQTVAGSDGQVAVYCTVSLWYRQGDDDKVSVVYGVGGDMVVVKQSNGLRTDDEAFKKAFTDAIGNAMKHLGMSADVHMGLFDDSKYVADATAAHAAPMQQISSYRAKQLLKTDVLLGEIDKAATTNRCDELAELFRTELAFLPASWTKQFMDRIEQRRTELVQPAVSANETLDRQFAETIRQ